MQKSEFIQFIWVNTLLFWVEIVLSLTLLN